VATRLEALCLIVLYAMSSVIGPIVGQNWGAGRKDRVGHVIYKGARFSLIWGMSTAVFLWIAALPLIGLFDDNPAAVDSAFWYLMIVPFTYSFLGVAMIAGSMMNGIGAPKASLFFTFSRLLLLYLPPALL